MHLPHDVLYIGRIFEHPRRCIWFVDVSTFLEELKEKINQFRERKLKNRRRIDIDLALYLQNVGSCQFQNIMAFNFTIWYLKKVDY